LEVGNVGFFGTRKIGEPGERPSEQGENKQKTQCTYDTEPESKSGPSYSGIDVRQYKPRIWAVSIINMKITPFLNIVQFLMML